MIPVSAPPRVLRRLRETADGPLPVVHRGRDAVYVALDGGCVGVVTPRATAVPCALRCRAERLEVTVASLRSGVLHLDGEPLVVGRVVDVCVPPIAVGSGEPAPMPGEARFTIGRGDGLTPYADDVWCGWLATHRASGIATPDADGAVRACLDRTTLLSATLLECAMNGEVVPQFAAYLSALDSPDEEDRTVALTAVGHSSGRGLLHGATLALRHLSLSGAAA